MTTNNVDPAILVINIKHQLTEEFCKNIIEISRYGIVYWAPEGREIPGGGFVAYEDDGEGGKEAEHVIDVMKIHDGLCKLMDPAFSINSKMRATILEAMLHNDAGNIDADGADSIVQAACFGELKYG